MCKRSTSIIVAGLTLGGLLFIGSPAGAQSVYNLDQREDRQQQRIQQGVDSGALTPGEARRLEGEQARIQATEDRMRADGHLSPRERERLSQMENRAGRDIDRLKHNDRTAEGWGGNNYHGWGGHHNSGWDGNPAVGGYAYDPRFDRREDRQQYRIQQGIHSGALAPGEARYLEREQGRVQAAEDRMKADGRLSPWERQRLNQMQNRASGDINRLDHNGRTYGGNQAGWQGNNQGWGGRGYGQGNNPGQYGTTPSGTPVNGATSGTTTPGYQGWRGNNPGWNGSSSTGTSTTTGSTTRTGTTHGWGTHSGGSGYPSNGTATSGTTTPTPTTGTTRPPGIPRVGGAITPAGITAPPPPGPPPAAPRTPGTPTGTTTATNTQGWQGHHPGWNGSSPSSTATGGTTPSGTPAAGNTQGWRGNYGRNGQAGAYQQPNFQRGNPGQNANWQGQPRFQQPRPQVAPNMMRPNANMMARQPGGFGNIVNRAASTAARVAPRRR